MVKKKEVSVDTETSAENIEKEVVSCKRCRNPIANPNGDNGCGIHTEDGKTVTNCVPAN